jgi:hypothetical protein
VQIERVQRWVGSSLLLLVGSMLSLGMVLASLFVIEETRGGAQVGLVVMATVVAILTLLGIRLLNQLSLVTPWLLLGLLPAIIGGSLLATR